MKVLVTGGTGLVGAATVDRLLATGHSVRLLSRNADADGRRWPDGVESWSGDVTRDDAVQGAAEGCDAVVHAVGIVDESPPAATYRNVNVDGTRRIAEEARRAGARRFVYVSSLGAERGRSPYHQSKLAGERLVREIDPPGWLIVRPGNVYGPGDEVISLLLRLVRTFPALPTVGWGDHPFQPVWHEDAGAALAQAATTDRPARTALDLAGPDVTTTREVLDLLSELTGSSTASLPIPPVLARLGMQAAEALGMDLPLNQSQLTMLIEENVIGAGVPNALTEVFGIRGTGLREGVRKLVECLPAQLPSTGHGAMRRERFWADIAGAQVGPGELMEIIRMHFAELPRAGLLTVGAEADSPRTLQLGNTLTLGVPVRGHVPVRVVEVAERTVTLVTVEGHFLAGVVRFLVRTPDPEAHPDEAPPAGRLRFEVRAYVRAATTPDLVAMRLGGAAAQAFNWSGVVQEVVRRSGGVAPEGVRHESEVLEEREAERVERWVEETVLRFEQGKNGQGG